MDYGSTPCKFLQIFRGIRWGNILTENGGCENDWITEQNMHAPPHGMPLNLFRESMLMILIIQLHVTESVKKNQFK